MVMERIDPELLPLQAVTLDILNDLAGAREIFLRGMMVRQKNIPAIERIEVKDEWLKGFMDEPDVRVKTYTPVDVDGPMPALIWCHGGGYVLGSVDVESPAMQRMADSLDCVIVAVEYRLAPEHPFPAALHDGYAALSWVFDHAASLNVDSTRIAVGGVSAGGGLAAALALMVREKGEYQLAFQYLRCPMLDDRHELPSTHLPLDGIAWDRARNQYGWRAYLGEQSLEHLPIYAIPGRVEDLSNLAPAYIAVGSVDLFLDENMAYARRLLAAGVAAELHVFAGGYHGFEFIKPAAQVSQRANNMGINVLRQAFNKPTLYR